VFPEIVAGPDLMERVTGKSEDAVMAPMLKEGAPKTWLGIGEKELMVCDARETTKLVVTSGAALQFALPGWFAAIVTDPTPVNVTVPPLIVAGPDLMERETGKLDDALRAPMLKAVSPKM